MFWFRKLSNEVPRDKNILFVAATNRPEILDEAILRPGRIDRVIYVPHPDRDARLEILKLYCKNIPLEDDVDLDMTADKTEIFSGADLKNVCREVTTFIQFLNGLHTAINCVDLWFTSYMLAGLFV